MQSDPSDQQVPPHPQPPQPPRRLHREPEERRLWGVCGGLADYFGLDPTLMRLLVVALTFFNGMAIVAYLIAACVIPLRPRSVPRVQATPVRLGKDWNPGVLVLLAIVAIAVMAGGSWGITGDGWWLNGPAFGVLLVGFGVWLLLRQDRPDSSEELDTTSGQPTTLAGEAASDRDIQDGDAPWTTVPSYESGHRAGPRGEVPPPIPPWGPTKPESPAHPLPGLAPPSRPRQPFQKSLWAILLIATGVVTLLGLIKVIDGVGGTLGAVLIAIGLLMIVGAWRGRTRFLMVVGLPLVMLLTFADLVDLPVNGAITERTVDLTSSSDLKDDHELLAGSLTLHIEESALASRSTSSVSADVGMGELIVIVPEDVTAEVDADVGIGELQVGDVNEGGLDIEDRLTLPGVGADPHTVRLDLHVGMGELQVRHG